MMSRAICPALAGVGASGGGGSDEPHKHVVGRCTGDGGPVRARLLCATAAAAAAPAPAPVLSAAAPVPAAASPGRAVQVGPMKPKLKPPGTKLLKLMCDILLSNFASKFNLRRYIPDYVYGYGAAPAYYGCERPVHLNMISCQRTGAKAEAWCLLIHADASLSLLST